MGTKTWLVIGLCFCFSGVPAQGLLDELKSNAPKEKEYAIATFKAPRIIQGHSIEAPGKGELMFIIQHRFGRINTGFYELFGWDQASIRIGLEYTLPFSDRFNVGFGRSSYGKTWDFFLKTKLLRQAKGGSPLSISWVSTLAINSLDWANPNQQNYFSSRLAYSHQLLLARKFNSWFSFQLSPTLVHKNLVPLSQDQNSFFSLGMGGRVKVSNRVSINAEYTWLLPGQHIPKINGLEPQNAISLGVDIETGGHVFQLHVTNTQAMFDVGSIAETTGRPELGDIHVGFNITRTFSFKRR
jgi:hypothetical protein